MTTAAEANDNYPGTIEGEFTVDQNGSAVYSVPLRVPPGTAGMQPDLSLTYHSSLLNGMLGVGWSLGKLSAIRRVGATPAQDNFRGGLHYDARDRFALDGQRLMAVQGDYGAKGTIYHTEIESWQKVVPVFEGKSDAANGPASFMVYDRNGHCYEYGTSDDSRIRPAAGHPAIRVWALSKVTDPSGNFMTLKYSRDPLTSAYYPARIDYTGNAGLTPRRSVVFTYEGRGDITPSYEAGYATHYTRRLKQIQTMVDDGAVLTYSLDYKQGSATGRSQLRGITLSDARGKNMTPTLFDWHDLTDLSFGAPESLPDVGLAIGGAVVPLDVNGDGYRDLITARAGDEYKLLLTLLLARSDGKGFSAPAAVPTAGLVYSEQCEILPLDINADGCSDVVYVANNGGALGLTIFTAVNESSRWTLKQGEAHAAGPADIAWGGQIIPMDIDGDGRTDLVYASADDSGHLELTVLVSTGARFERASKTSTDLPYDRFIQLFPLDLNGDGMSDLVYAYNDETRLGLKCFLSSGTKLEPHRGEVLPADLALPFGGALMPLNVKEDGNEDLVYACASEDSGELVLYTLLSTGAVFRLASPRPDKTGLHYTGSLLPVVVRGTGHTDLLLTSPDESSGGASTVAQLLRSTGSGFAPVAAPVKLPLSWGGQTLPLDLRGVGKTDLLYVTPGDGLRMRFTRLPAPAAVPDRVSKITNGLGTQYEITYRPITDPGVYAKDDAPQGGSVDPKALVNSSVSGSSWPLAAGSRLANPTAGAAYTTNSRQFAEYVVSAAVVRDGRGNEYRYQYRYKGARIDLSGHGWLGFATKESVDADIGTTTVEEYEQAFPLTFSLKSGRLLRSEDSALLSQVAYAYEHSTAGPGVHKIESRGVTTRHYTSGNLDRTDTVTHKYDSYGNVILTSTKSGASPEIYTAFAYDDNDLNQWRFGAQKEKLVTADAAGQQVLTREKFVNDPRTGRHLESHVWEDQNKRWLITKYEYDAYGNQTSVTDPAGAVTRAAYDEAYRTFVVLRTLPANEAGLAITLGSESDPRFGVETLRTDANGIKWINKLDGLGRTIEMQGPDPQMKAAALTQKLFGVDNYGYYEETRHLAQWGGADWMWTRKYYDGLAREYKTTAPSDEGSALIVVDRVRNSKGQVLQETLSHFAGTEPRVITRRYDPLGRMVREEQPIDGGGSRVTQVTYPSVDREVQVEAAGTQLARTTTREYSTFADKRSLVRSTDAAGAVTKYDYDALGRLITATDPNGLTQRSLYDSLNRRVGLTVAKDQKTFAGEKVSYDDLARTVLVRTNKGSEILLKHDARNRLKERVVTSAGSQPVKTTYRYDSGGSSLALDRLAQVAMPDGILYSYDYDAHGNIANETVVLDGQTYKFGKSYTPGGQVASLVYPDGSSLKNRYTIPGHLAEVELAEGGAGSSPKRYAGFEQFTPFGRAGVIKYGNGVTEAAGYNLLGQIKSQSVNGAGGNKLADAAFQWNALHSLTRIEDKLDPKHTQALSYDEVGRLTRATRNADGAAAERLHYDFRYDAAGNLKMKDGIEYTYEGHQATRGLKGGAEVFAADYDADGAMERVTRNGKTDGYVFDALGCLRASKEATFVYDHAGRRLIKKSSAGMTTYYISPVYEVSLLPGGGRQITRYVPGPYGPIAQVTSRVSGPPADAAAQSISLAGVPAEGVSYFHRNYINSTTLHTDERGQVLASVQYLPFGEIYSINGRDVFRAKFTGRELDYETGLYYFDSRYYDPGIGRFIATDDRLGGSFGAADSLNRYAYVLNNPITGIDLDGHFRWDIFADVLIGIAAVTLIVAGTVATGGAAGPLLALAGSTLLGAAISGTVYSATHSGENFSWGGWGTEVGIGAATGFLTGLAGGVGVAGGGWAARGVIAGAKGAAVSLSRQAASHATRLLITTAAGAAGSMLAGYVGRGFHNVAKGQSWNEGWEASSLWKDALQGAATGFLSGAASAYLKPVVQRIAQANNVTYGTVLAGGLTLTAFAGLAGNLAASHLNSAQPAGSNISPDRPADRPEPRASLQFTPRVWLPSMG